MPAPDIAELTRQAEGHEHSARVLSGSDPYADRSGDSADRARRHEQDAADLRRRIATAQTKRKADLAAIHAQAKKQGIDEDTRRVMIRRLSQGRTASSGDLTAPERAALLKEIGGGRRPPPKRAGRGPGAQALDRRAMLTKVEALLADSKLPWAYAEAILRRQRGILDKAVACPIAQSSDQELRGVIAALDRRAKREAAKARGAA